MNLITQVELKKLIHYNPDTGRFFWLERPVSDFTSGKHSATHIAARWNSKFAGKPAGALRKSKDRNTDYMRLNINGKFYYLHRLAWLYVTGSWPCQIDHINGDGLDNRFANLREVDNSVNHTNMPLQSNNVHGLPGLTETPWGWAVRIKRHGRMEHLGTFTDFFNACCVRKSAELRFNFHENHGRSVSSV